uniref:NPL domain-containing protein n=1 Tax=Ascaris lumbricoides TaxID=6252 RepID=A0A0M3HJ49_ASCLU
MAVPVDVNDDDELVKIATTSLNSKCRSKVAEIGVHVNWESVKCKSYRKSRTLKVEGRLIIGAPSTKAKLFPPAFILKEGSYRIQYCGLAVFCID